MLPSEPTIHDRYRIIYDVDRRPGYTLYRVRDEQTNRLMLLAGLAYTPAEQEDLQLLARQVATLRHEALLPLTDHFAEQDQYYLVCEDVSGQDLERTLRARGGAFPESETLTQIRRLLDTLEYLHSQKPALFLGDPLLSDLLVRDDGAWRLTPFALIRSIEHNTSAYRAPELDQHDAEPAPASDLYALTALLYHALTGWAPPAAAQRQAGTPLNGPRNLNSQLSPLAEQVLLRGLQLRPENRYQVPAEMRLSLDMVQLMAGRSLGIGPDAVPGAPAPLPHTPPLPPVQPATYTPPPAAQPAPAPYGLPSAPPEQFYPTSALPAPAPEGQRRSMRTGCLVAVAVALAVAAVAVCAALAWFIPGSPLPSLLGGAATGVPAGGSAPGAPTSLPAGDSSVAGVPTSAPLPTLEPLELDAGAITLQNAAQITQTRVITNAEVGPVAYSPDGSILAIGISNVINLRNANTLEEFSPPRQLVGHSGKLFTLAFSPDGKTIASGAINENTVRLWDVASGTQLHRLDDHRGWIRAVAFSADGKMLASGGFDGSAKLWDVASGNLLRTLSGHSGFISTVAFSPDGKTLATSASDGQVRLWDAASGAQRSGFTWTPAPNLNTNAPLWATGLAFAGDGATLAVGSEDGSIVLVDATTGANRHTLLGHTDIVVSRGLVFAPDGKMLASAGFDGTVRLWDAASGTQTAELRGHGMRVLALAFSPDGKFLVSTSDRGGQLLLWDIAEQTAARSLQIGQGLVTSLAFSADSKVLGSVGYNGTARLNLLDQDRFQVLFGSAASINSLAFLPDGRLVSISDQGRVVLIDPGQNRGRTLEGLDGRALNVAASADGALIVAGSSTGAIARWDGDSASAQPPLQSDHFQSIVALAVSPDGALIAVSGPSNDPRVEIWDTAGGKLLHTLLAGESAITAMAFQPRGALLAVANLEGKLFLWNVRDGTLAHTISAPRQVGRYAALAFAPDGSLLVTGAASGELGFWQAQAGEQIGSLILPNPDGIYAAAFSPDGHQLALGLGDQTVRVLELLN